MGTDFCSQANDRPAFMAVFLVRSSLTWLGGPGQRLRLFGRRIQRRCCRRSPNWRWFGVVGLGRATAAPERDAGDRFFLGRSDWNQQKLVAASAAAPCAGAGMRGLQVLTTTRAGEAEHG